jgi:hypothetical protein
MTDDSETNDHGLYHSKVMPVELEHLKSHAQGRDSVGLFNDCGFVVRARAESGEDIHLWMFIYQQRGSEVVIDGDITQTLLVYGKFSDEAKKSMHDTPYINKGQNIDDYQTPGSIQIEEDAKSVTWTHTGREFVCQPPNYRIRGSHAGVKVELDFKQSADGFYHCGPFEALKADSGIAGYIVHGRVNGVIEVEGKTLKIVEGHGIHERLILGGTIPPRIDYNLGGGSQWAHGWGDEFSWYTLTGAQRPSATAMVLIDGEPAVAQGLGKAVVTEEGKWLDPKTNQMNPYKWRVQADTDKGKLDAVVSAYGRGFYTWTRKNGSLLVNQYLADCVATFTRTDGRVIKSNQVASLEYMRTLYRQANDN